jgi:hypothetical protein
MLSCLSRSRTTCQDTGRVIGVNGIGLDWVYDMESLMVLVKQMAETYPDGAYNHEIQVAQPERPAP